MHPQFRRRRRINDSLRRGLEQLGAAGRAEREVEAAIEELVGIFAPALGHERAETLARKGAAEIVATAVLLRVSRDDLLRKLERIETDSPGAANMRDTIRARVHRILED